MKESKDARRIAMQVLQRVLNQGESLSQALPELTHGVNAQDKAFIQMLVYGVCRWYPRLDVLLGLLMKKALKAKDSDVRIHLLMALYQLMDTRVPDYASVDAAVGLVKKKKVWAAGLVNAVLRNFIRKRVELLQQTDSLDAARYAHPQWMIDRLQQDWPSQWMSILEANNRQAPMVLRVNQQHISVIDYLQQLTDKGIAAQALPQPVTAVMLDQPQDVMRLPGYAEGWFSVQDAGAQQAAPLVDLQPALRVLDACAAPGGKTGHLLEVQPDIQLTALDISESRLQRVEENLARLQFDAELVAADVAEPQHWWDDRPYDRILLDVPCSASGVIRRHPDIKLLRRDDDIDQLVDRQQHILHQAWSILAPGGLLLYVTCSVFKQENEQQLAGFLASHADASEVIIDANWGEARPVGRQILPGEQNMDGFYYGLLAKSHPSGLE